MMKLKPTIAGITQSLRGICLYKTLRIDRQPHRQGTIEVCYFYVYIPHDGDAVKFSTRLRGIPTKSVGGYYYNLTTQHALLSKL